MNLLTYLPDGQAVCADHYLPICGKCCVDFTDPVFQRDSEEDSDEDDRVFVLGEGVNRFVPQWDDQVLGPANTYRIRKDYDNPPTPEQLQASSLHTCSSCEVTWLIGKAGQGAAASHPSHYTLSHPYAATRRSLVVHTDGACLDNGRASARAGTGVYFGPNSKYNLSLHLQTSRIPTNQIAELTALLQAMQIVRNEIVPARSDLVRGDHDTKHFRLVLVTDSSYAVECMCKHWKNWTVSTDGKVLRNRQGKAVVNSDILLEMKDEVDRLSRVGVQVTYYHVRREFNRFADALAKAGAEVTE